MERLQKILSAKGVCSRRAAEDLIKAGRVTCNGVVCALGDCADPDVDEILVDGKALPTGPSPVYIMLHKPKGYVTTLSDERGRKNVAELVTDCKTRIYPIGRLDMDSEGLLLMTNDGEFANKLMHPKHEVNKVYRVFVDGYSPDALERVKQPIMLDGYRIKRPDVQVLETKNDQAVLVVTIHEGRNRQVRRMCAYAGVKVRRLVRIREGAVCLGDLPAGKWRYLTEQEIKVLQGG